MESYAISKFWVFYFIERGKYKSALRKLLEVGKKKVTVQYQMNCLNASAFDSAYIMSYMKYHFKYFLLAFLEVLNLFALVVPPSSS